MNNIERVSCCTCGHEWYKGVDGSHQCSTYLLRRIRTLESGLQALISVAEDCDGWESFPLGALEHASDTLNNTNPTE